MTLLVDRDDLGVPFVVGVDVEVVPLGDHEALSGELLLGKVNVNYCLLTWKEKTLYFALNYLNCAMHVICFC